MEGKALKSLHRKTFRKNWVWIGETYRSERGIQRPVTEAMLKKQVEFLLNKTLHHHSAEKRDRKCVLSTEIKESLYSTYEQALRETNSGMYGAGVVRQTS